MHVVTCTIHTDPPNRSTALMRDSSKIIAISRAGPAFSRSQIQVFSSAGEGLLLLNVDILLLYTLGDDADELADSGIREESFGLDGQPTSGWSCSTKRVSTGCTTSRATTNNIPSDQKLRKWESLMPGSMRTEWLL